MISQPKYRNHILIMLFLSIVLFVSAFVLVRTVENYNSPLKSTQRLQKEIGLAFSALEAESEIIAKQDLNKRDSFLEFLSLNYRNKFAEKGIEILVYTNDSLQFWTSNVFAAPIIFSSSDRRLASDVVETGNGYYILKRKQHNNHQIIVIQLLKHNYRYENEYLPRGFNKQFSAPQNAAISMAPGKYQIYSTKGTFLFSLNFSRASELALWAQYILFIIYLSGFLCIVAAMFAFYSTVTKGNVNKSVYFLVFLFSIILLRYLQLLLRFPAPLYQIHFFNPEFFASSDLLPSLGDLLINAFLGLQLSYLLFKHFNFRNRANQWLKYSRLLLLFVFMGILLLCFTSLVDTISGLVINSSISFDFENILSMKPISHFGMVAIALLLSCFLFIFQFFAKEFFSYFRARKKYSLFALIASVVSLLLFFLFSSFHIVPVLVFLVLFWVYFLLSTYYSNSKSLVIWLIPGVFILSLLGTIILNTAETSREHDKRILLATRLADARDNVAEYYYSEAAKEIGSDVVLSHLIEECPTDSVQTQVANYIKDRYFSGFWKKYIVQITVCQRDKSLRIQPGNVIANCEDYFRGKIDQFMEPVSVPGLFFLKQSVDAMYYLGQIKINPKGIEKSNYINIFIEISSNDIWKGLGYPELLIDNRNTNTDNYSGYSYAFYSNGELIKNVGKFSYNLINKQNINTISGNKFSISNGFSHFSYTINKNFMVIISKENAEVSNLITPFSYLFLLQIFILLIIRIIDGKIFNFRMNIYTFRFRLQVILIAVIVLSSIVLVTVSVLFINKLNTNKNNRILTEKLNSALIDVETRYGSEQSFDRISQSDLSELLRTLSNTYFSDINIFNRQGFLLASSREQIFSEGMLAEQINFESAMQLIVANKTFFIQKEHIGDYSFLSAYTPIRNNENQLLGYLNLPYFARQEEIRHEISGLITAFANIYLVMILITVLVALVLAQYITKPLKQIGIQFSKFKIGNSNAKIDWERKDEIGQLVNEYNRMVDELERSAELLAKSERESAWREMAKQVAHEIKNPLTPIKLSMQLLMRAWDDKAPDWEARLKRFSQTLIMQIDTLSAIASEFSDFAQMPEPQIQAFDIVPLVQQAGSLFHNQSFCRLEVDSTISNCIIKADPNQILRVFNNLIKNALQSIPADRQGLLLIKLTQSDAYCEISFQDNGTGISTESQSRIFSPNFTTKTAGMGLGLAMVKNIIDSVNGKIWFETIPDKGTTFIIQLPIDRLQS